MIALEPSKRLVIQRFPTRIWRNGEMLRFLDWLRQHNEIPPGARRTALRGLEAYSLAASIEAVMTEQFDAYV